MSQEQKLFSSFPASKGMETIDRILNGYKSYHVMVAALDIGLFDWLKEKGSATQQSIEEGLRINGMLLKSFLQSLVDLGLLKRIGETFANSDVSEELLVRTSPFFQGSWVGMTTGDGSQWSNLKSLLCSSEAYSVEDIYANRENGFMEASLQGSLRGELQAVTERISNWNKFIDARLLLDIGGDHGLYAVALCHQHPSLKAVVADDPIHTAAIREFIARQHMADRIEVREDGIEGDIGSGYDVIIISHLLYKYRKDLSSIIHKVGLALKEGGLMISNHMFCAPGCVPIAALDPNQNNTSGLKEIERSIASSGHPLCHVEVFPGLLRDSGFTVLDVSETKGPHGETKLHVALKDTEKPGRGSGDGCC